MLLGFHADSMLSKHGWQPGAGSSWDTHKAAKELTFFRNMGLEAYESMAGMSSKTAPWFQYSDDEWRTARKVVEDAGMNIYSILAWRRMICRPPWAEEKWQDLLHIAHVAEILGVKAIVIFIAPPIALGPVEGKPPRPMIRSLWDATDRDFEISAEKLKQYCRQIAGFGAEISLEIHADCIHDCAPSALRLLHMIDEPNVGINPDTLDNRWLFPGEDVPDPIEQAHMVAKYVNLWHIKQYLITLNRETNEWELKLEHADEGSFPIGEMMRIFIKAGFKGAAIHECGRGGDPAYSLKRFTDYMKWLRDEYVPNMPD